ncbi:hypothetical protein HKX48_007996 [Thoreauomyces humboldtii]|nr:hypothetical protein HKX48_007996 [Thoreauomyces humboldtii]
MAAAAGAAVPATTEVRTFEWAEVAAHKTRDDLWMVIDGKVYDATKFLDEHPGGEEVMVEVGGQDASEAFEEIGHSDDARGLLTSMYLGDLSLAAKSGKAAHKLADKAVSKATGAVDSAKAKPTSTLFALIPLVVIVAFAAYKYLEQQA